MRIQYLLKIEFICIAVFLFFTKQFIMYTITSGNIIITSGREKMGPDGINSFVKQCIVSTPYIFREVPIVTLNIYTITGTEAFVVHGMEHFYSTGQTTFKITATNNDIGRESANEYYCDYMIMGQLAEEAK